MTTGARIKTDHITTATTTPPPAEDTTAHHAATAVELQARIDQLQAQVAQLEDALRTRSPIEHALGMIMLSAPCGPDAAWTILARTSQNLNIKVRDLADAMVERTTQGKPLSPDVSKALRHMLTSAKS